MNSYENGTRVVIFDYLGNEIGTGRVRSGDNYPVSNKDWTYVTTTWHGETRTEAWPTAEMRPTKST